MHHGTTIPLTAVLTAICSALLTSLCYVKHANRCVMYTQRMLLISLCLCAVLTANLSISLQQFTYIHNLSILITPLCISMGSVARKMEALLTFKPF